MVEAVEGPPAVGVELAFEGALGVRRTRRAVGQQLDVGTGGAQRDRLLLEVDLRAERVGICEGAKLILRPI